jgi:hypothetical protein
VKTASSSVNELEMPYLGRAAGETSIAAVARASNQELVTLMPANNLKKMKHKRRRCNL